MSHIPRHHGILTPWCRGGWWLATIRIYPLTVTNKFIVSLRVAQCIFVILICFRQRVRHTAFSARRPPTSEFISGHILCGRDVFNRRLRRLRTGHLALATVHGHYDMRGFNCPPDPGK